ncbi:MAG: class I SAM-dependent methyltransferase [Caldilineaceae bacterium]
MMDELARYNKERWEELARAKVEFTLPFLNLTVAKARAWLEDADLIARLVGDLAGKEVLCLAASGGQQSAVFGLLGAKVTVLDLAETQLERDQQAANHYGYAVKTVAGDMRDLSCFADDAFDLIYQAYSINFVPSVEPVFREAARVLRLGGLYHMQCANPFTQSVDSEAWDGETYLLHHPYIDGFEVTQYYPHWDIEDDDGGWRQLDSPREFRHALSTVINTLAANNFVILRNHEAVSQEEDPEPGTWEHFKSVAPPYLTFWSIYRPELR